MADTTSIWERLGFRKASGVGEAGWGHTLFAAIISLIYFLPVLIIILTSFKLQTEALAVPPKLLPTSFFGLIPEQYVFSPTLENFTSVFSRAYVAGGAAESTGFDRFFFNSIFIASTSVLLALVIGTLAAYGFSRYPLKGNDTYLFIILTTRMLPAIVVIIPVILMFRVAGLAGSYPGIIFLYTAFNLPFTIWMMKSFFDELSPDVEDAARIDGSSDVRVFLKICLPQVLAGLAATFVFGLILTWNEFLFALLLTGVDTRTVPVAMNQAVAGGGIGVLWGLLAAIETLFLIPVFLVTFFLQNHLLRGVTFGTVKR
ncbi:carbohydrate ABC transporter permease [Nordella sp. HKS 07]|uniref:carbohydrate ABC transporter permease n=1 Tax=Nordella sp. HKS 07 TaxID=2712222 RepID=UPI0013E208B0|nr:carbohydrate ABC transporter permease [Nordella sp. HKS 07]QIG52054.1 carbohydrate ABC transporter permease [Nordella sp. HKS 07]